jgi:hypothetical protein
VHVVRFDKIAASLAPSDDRRADVHRQRNGQPAKRHVSTKDDGAYDAGYRWQGGVWVRKA